ncbi:hypothetical protein EOD08_19815, partial [Mesorhizobium sp. M6A.T.Ca.TU.002.02.2.1]
MSPWIRRASAASPSLDAPRSCILRRRGQGSLPTDLQGRRKDMSLKGKTLFISGGSRGIGLA